MTVITDHQSGWNLESIDHIGISVITGSIRNLAYGCYNDSSWLICVRVSYNYGWVHVLKFTFKNNHLGRLTNLGKHDNYSSWLVMVVDWNDLTRGITDYPV